MCLFLFLRKPIAIPEAMSVEFASSILNAICPEILRPVGYDFSKVNRARVAITNVYSSRGLLRGECNNWGEADKRCAYMLRWFLIHCQFVPQFLMNTPDILNKFPPGKRTLLCLLYQNLSTWLRVRVVFHKTVRVCHVYCNFKLGFTCRITVILEH